MALPMHSGLRPDMAKPVLQSFFPFPVVPDGEVRWYQEYSLADLLSLTSLRPWTAPFPGASRSPFCRFTYRGSLHGRGRRWRPSLVYTLYFCPGCPCGRTAAPNHFMVGLGTHCTSTAFRLAYTLGLGFQRAGRARRDPSDPWLSCPKSWLHKCNWLLQKVCPGPRRWRHPFRLLELDPILVDPS